MLSKMSLIASSDCFLVVLLVDLPIYASIACVNASKPVVEVRCFGNVNVATGSSTANSGTNLKSLIVYFSCVFESLITEVIVVSLPVPAVVGTQKIGGNL